MCRFGDGEVRDCLRYGAGGLKLHDCLKFEVA